MSLARHYATTQAFENLKQGHADNQLARQAGGMIASGDTTGASNALFRGGQLEAGQTVRTNAKAQHKAEVEFAGNLATGLAKRIQAGKDAETAWSEAHQWAASQGMGDQMPVLRQQYDQMGAEAFTSWLGSAAAKEYQLFQNESGIYGVNKADPTEVVTSKRFPSKPTVVGDWAYMPQEVEENSPPPNGARPPQAGTATRDTNGNAVPPPPAPPAEAYREAIAGIESKGSGDYKARGPVTRSGDRAYGRYQVMGANIPQWTREALGREMTPQEFRANPQAQDAVFDHRFGSYVEKYGSPEEAASVWFTGKPQAQGANRSDVNGMTGARYVQKFAAGMGGGAPQLQGGAGSDDVGGAPQIPGMRVVGRVKGGEGAEWRSDGKGVLINRNGDRKRDPSFAGSQGRMATAADKTRLGLAPDAPYWIDENGKPSAVSGEKPNKPLTEYQGKSVELLNAALGGNERLNELAGRGLYKPRTATDSLFHNEKDGTKRLILRTEEDRQFVQAAKEWLAPILRKESGAAVTDGELATYMDIYIPKYEDSPQVMWQKAQARDRKMSSIYTANKGAYDSSFGAPGRWQVLADPRGQRAKTTAPAKASSGWGKVERH